MRHLLPPPRSGTDYIAPAIAAGASQCQRSSLRERPALALVEQTPGATLTFKVHFTSGADHVLEADRQRLRFLAQLLQEFASVHISLQGHADPVGTDEYNNVLARERALAVRTALIEFGVEQSRLDFCGFGASGTRAWHSRSDIYAYYRRVDVVLQRPAHPIKTLVHL